MASGNRQIVYAVEAALTITGCCMNIPFSNLFVNWVMFGIVSANVLQFKLRNSCTDPAKSEENVVTELKWCIKFHEKLIR